MIETAVGYGDFYLNLTAELAAQYRQGASEVPDTAPQAAVPLADTPEPTEEPPPTAPPATDTPSVTDTPTSTPTASSSPTPTATSTPTSTPTHPAPDTPTPLPTSTLVGRAAARPGGRWGLGAAVALLAAGVVAQALRLRREVVRG